MVFFYKIGEQESRSDSAQRQGVGEVAQIMYTHVSRCKNYKIKFKKRKKGNYCNQVPAHTNCCKIKMQKIKKNLKTPDKTLLNYSIFFQSKRQKCL
jgi:hypothetical protein